LPRDGASGREEADGPVVGGDDAEDVPDDDGGDLERGDAASQGRFRRHRAVRMSSMTKPPESPCAAG
jgi:hypothetical protein